jgi:mRNA interferase RelE/StbE
MPYRIVLSRSATKELAALPAKVHDNVISHIRQLESNPRTTGAEKLTGIDAYKLRVRNYRIIFKIDDRAKEIEVVMVDDRKQVYQRLKRKK